MVRCWWRKVELPLAVAMLLTFVSGFGFSESAWLKWLRWLNPAGEVLIPRLVLPPPAFPSRRFRHRVLHECVLLDSVARVVSPLLSRKRGGVEVGP